MAWTRSCPSASSRSLKNASEVYGTFAFVIGLLWWIFMQAQFTLYALEIDVVRGRKLWPRSLVQPPLTEADERAYQIYAEEEKRRDPQEVDVRPNEPVETEALAGAPLNPQDRALDGTGRCRRPGVQLEFAGKGMSHCGDRRKEL
jgi:hypothetical protein